MKIVYEGWDPGANALQFDTNAAQYMSLCACSRQLQGSTAGRVNHIHPALWPDISYAFQHMQRMTCATP
jgi:hypothetical protein